MKRIFIVLTYTGTIPAKVIRFWTKKKYSHVSISLDESLTRMYSFARLGEYNIFNAGFLHEYINKGIFKKFKNTDALIGYLEVSNRQYKKIENEIVEMEKERDKYKFNIKGFLAVAFKKRIIRKNYFYCAEFVRYVLDEAYIDTELPEIIIPTDFQKMKNLNFIYKGKLRDYVA